MQVFEFHFNPKFKKDLVFDSFCYEPATALERKLGNLYMAGLLKNALPQNGAFLEKLSRTVKDNFYKTLQNDPEKALREALRKTNDFLEKSARDGDVSWLGNLNFGVISIKNLDINFTKVGEIKIFLLRKGQLIDTDEKVKLDGIEPYPLKVFGNIISGKLAQNDTVLVMSGEVFNVFKTAGILSEIARIPTFSQKSLKQILDEKKVDLSRIFGLCLFISLTEGEQTQERESFRPKNRRIFSLKEALLPVTRMFRLPKLSFKKPTISIPKFKLPQISLSRNLPSRFKIISSFAVILVLGFFVFRGIEQKQLKEYRQQFTLIQETVSQADTYLLLAESNSQANKQAADLLADAWDKISPLSDLSVSFPADFSNDILNLKNDVSSKLSKISNLKMIEDIQPIYEFKTEDFIPQRMISLQDNLYLFSPYAENVAELNGNNEERVLQKNESFNSASPFSNAVLLFSKPNKLTLLKNGSLQDLATLQNPPYASFNYKDFAAYQGNLYLLESKQNVIIKYPYLGNNQWGQPQSWLTSPLSDNADDLRSMAVDGSLWLLNADNSVDRYYAGALVDTLKMNIFPRPRDFTKIFTSSQLPYLYLLEPSQKRIVVIDKISGATVTQLQSQDFNNLLDFTVSENGKAIYLLDGLKVYQISVNY